MTARTSLTPESSAESWTNCRLVASEMTCASVVLPVPGGPYSTSDIGSSDSTSRRSGARGPSRCCWPTTSSSARGRMRTARGAPGSAEGSSAGASNNELTVAKLPATHDGPGVQQRRIGSWPVGAVGLGAMPLSTKRDRPSPSDAEATVHAALDAGVTLIDTADAYSWDEAEFGHNEELIAYALRSYGRTPDVLVATKGGHTRDGTAWGLDGSPAYLRRACEGSLRRLHVEAIGLYQLHRPDPATPWEESMGGLRALHDDGLVQMVGISNASIPQIDSARKILGAALVSVQNQFSPEYLSSLE